MTECILLISKEAFNLLLLYGLLLKLNGACQCSPGIDEQDTQHEWCKSITFP